MSQYIVWFLLFLLPLVFIPGINFPFETPKVILAEILIEALLVWQVFKNQLNFKRINRVQLGLFLSFILLTLISNLTNSFNPNLFFGNIFRLQGVFLFWHLLVFSLLVGFLNTEFSKKAKFIPLMSLVALFFSTLFLGTNQTGRAIGTLGEPNSLAAVAVFLFIFTLFQKFSTKLKVLSFVLSLIIIFYSGSRSGLIGLGIILVFLGLIKYLKVPLIFSLLIALGLYFSSLFLPFIEGGGWYENRAEIWQTAFQAGVNKPLLGWGFGDIETALKQTSFSLGNNVHYQVIDSSHNFLLDFWVQGGILGMVLMLTLLIWSFSNLVIKKDYLVLSCLLLSIIALSFNPLSVCVLLFFWWVVGRSFLNVV